MKKITLDNVIEEQNINDPEFSEYYQRELLINEISRMVIKLRTAAHLTQAELADKAKTTQPVIARLESGTDTRIPSLALLARIAAASHTRLHVVFDEFNSEEQDYNFNKTVLAIALAQHDEKFVTRSQAKRLLEKVPRYKIAIFDFKNIDWIGPSFADEIFRVFALQHPDIILIAINTVTEVKKMISRAKSVNL